MNLEKLSKTISHALRHQPSLYNLKLDKDGWVDINLLISAIRKSSDEFKFLERDDLERMINTSKKKRHQIVGYKIRASYGHSFKNRIVKQPCKPPRFLFHATKEEVLQKIFNEGIYPMNRQYVHLSENPSDSIFVALRKTKKPILLKINSLLAFHKGINFYKEEGGLWLSDKIDAEFLEEVKN